MNKADYTHRHPSTQHMIPWFEYKHLPPVLQETSKKFHDLAKDLIDNNEDSPEITAGLRKLLEAKDCFVRAATDKQKLSWTDR